MKLRSKILVLALSLCLCLSGLFGFVTEVNAEEYIDESVTVEDVVAGMASLSQLNSGQMRALTANAPIADGTYYLNGQYNGDYLKNDASSLATNSGLLTDLGESIEWVITNVNGAFTIRSVSDTTKYLAVPTSSTEEAAVQLVSVTGSSIPSECLWNISFAADTGCIIQNVYNSKYLYSYYGDTVATMSAIPSFDAADYNAYVWRVASTSYISGRELSASSSFSTLVIPYSTSGNVTTSPSFSKSPTNAIWASPNDFTYLLIINDPPDGPYVSEFNGMFTGHKKGVTTVIATHKVTDLGFVFAVVVGERPTLTIKNYVDQGFIARYNGDSEEDVDYDDMLESYNLFAQGTLEQFFGLDCTIEYVTFTSSADNCKTQQFGNDTDDWDLDGGVCPHGDDRHLGHDIIRNSAIDGSSNEVVVIWTGHVTKGVAESHATRHSVVIPFWVVTQEQPTLDVINARYTFELLHELSHQLGAHDHYCYANNERPCTNPWCEKHIYSRDPICTTVMGEVNYNLFASTSKSAWYCPMNLKEINDHLTAQCQ